MKKTFYRKLIRDHIPQIIKDSGGNYKTRVLDNDEYVVELKNKLIEESKEVSACKESELVNELADVLEVVHDIAAHHQIPLQDIKSRRVQKKKDRGGFKKRLFLIWSSKK